MSALLPWSADPSPRIELIWFVVLLWVMIIPLSIAAFRHLATRRRLG